VERRLGTIPTLVLMVACGALGMLAADGIESALAAEGSIMLAAGGNGVALGMLGAWAVLKASELRANPDEDVEVIGAAVCAAVLIMLPGRGRQRLRLAGGLVAPSAATRFAHAPRASASDRRRAVNKFTALTPELHRYAVERSSFRDGVVPGVEAAGEEWAIWR
jgi:hypothetical protein